VIEFNCPKCRQALEFADEAAGRIVRCPECRVKLRLPGELPPDEAPAEIRPRRKKRRRRRAAAETTGPRETPEWVAPSVVLGIGLLLSVGGMALTAGPAGFAAGLVIVLPRLMITVPLSIAGLYIAAPLLGITFGTIGLGILKIAAINVLTLSIAMTAMFSGVPAVVGYGLAAPIGWGLFKWFFELEIYETIFALTVIWLIQFMANLTLTAARLRAGG
jgi:hypothetical protein